MSTPEQSAEAVSSTPDAPSPIVGGRISRGIQGLVGKLKNLCGWQEEGKDPTRGQNPLGPERQLREDPWPVFLGEANSLEEVRTIAAAHPGEFGRIKLNWQQYFDHRRVAYINVPSGGWSAIPDGGQILDEQGHLQVIWWY